MSGETDRLLGYMPHVVRSPGLSDRERKFCASMVARSRRGAFRPSLKQVAVMKRLVSDFQDRELRLTDEGDDGCR